MWFFAVNGYKTAEIKGSWRQLDMNTFILAVSNKLARVWCKTNELLCFINTSWVYFAHSQVVLDRRALKFRASSFTNSEPLWWAGLVFDRPISFCEKCKKENPSRKWRNQCHPHQDRRVKWSCSALISFVSMHKPRKTTRMLTLCCVKNEISHLRTIHQKEVQDGF